MQSAVKEANRCMSHEQRHEADAGIKFAISGSSGWRLHSAFIFTAKLFRRCTSERSRSGIRMYIGRKSTHLSATGVGLAIFHNKVNPLDREASALHGMAL
jgi:hypothetical protein